MKRNIPKSALALLIIGLLTATITPAIGRFFFLPDFVKGFIMGLGLAFEVIALVIIQRSKKDESCTVWNN